MNIETGIVGIEQVKPKYRKDYEKFLEVYNKDILVIDQLEEQGKRDEAERLKTEIDLSRKVVPDKEDNNRTVLCLICGSFAVKFFSKDENRDIREYDCKVCGYNWLDPKTNE